MKIAVECHSQRNQLIADTYFRLRREHPELRPLEIFEQIVRLPAPRFYVSSERALRVTYSLMNHASIDHMQPTRARMFRDLLKVIERLRAERPRLSLPRIVEEAIMTPAPELYLTALSARQYFYIHQRRRHKRDR